ncbi:MAG: putative phosphodiesterase [Paraglaciecola sp.]|jgi:predicted phosphodiesterase
MNELQFLEESKVNFLSLLIIVRLMEKTKQIKVENAPLLLFGGVYSNFEALETLHGIAKKEGISATNVICTGDIVAYCADPEPCVKFVEKWGIHTIAGNVEIQLRNGDEGCGCDFTADSRCDLFARQWYPFAQKKVSESSVEFMRHIPEFVQFDYCGKRCTVVHGSHFHTSEYIFKSTPWNIKAKNLEATESEVIIAGHCGLPFNEVQNGQYWLNPGVIGMPANDGTTRVWYMILQPSDDGFTFEHRHFEFDYDETFARMLEEELPLAYAKTLSSGLWDNNDILPAEETAAQGTELVFPEI